MHGTGTDSDGTVASFEWDLDNDGVFGETGAAAQRGNEIGPNPTFDANGLNGPSTFLVFLRVIDNEGDASTLSQATVQVTNVAPSANAGGPYTVDEGGSVALAGTGTDPAGDALTFVWDLDADGLFGEVGAAAQRGDEFGSFPGFSAIGLDGPNSVVVRLRVTDADGGLSLVSTATIAVANVAPSANAGGSYAVATGEVVTLAGSGSDPAGAADQLSFQWDLDGDGQFGETGTNALRGNETGASPNFIATGLAGGTTATVSLRINDDDGGSSAISTATINISATPLIANAGGPYVVEEGSNVQLSGTAQGVSGSQVYEWDLDGDGVFGETGTGAARGNEIGAAPTFSALGLDGPTFANARLRIRDGANFSDVVTSTITVTNAAPMAFARGPYVIDAAKSVKLAGLASDPGGDNLTFNWDLDGDGVFGETGTVAERGNETGANPTFDVTGMKSSFTRFVGLRVTDDDGLSSLVDSALISFSGITDFINRAPLAQSTGPKTHLVIRAQPINLSFSPTSTILNNNQVMQSLQAMDEFFRVRSYGIVRMPVTGAVLVPGVITLPTNAGAINATQFHEAARAAAFALNPTFNGNNFDLVTVIHPVIPFPGYNYGGVALGSLNAMNMSNNINVGVWAHEFAHKLGLPFHADFFEPLDPNAVVADVDNATQYAYGNQLDVEGAAAWEAENADWGAYFKTRLNWWDLSHIRPVIENNTYRVYALDDGNIQTDRLYGLYLQRNDEQEYWLEHRVRMPDESIQNGLVFNIRNPDVIGSLAGGGSRQSPALIDLTPNSIAGGYEKDRNDAALAIGHTYHDKEAKLYVTPVARNAQVANDYIDVVINRGDFPLNVPPVASLVISTTSPAVGQSVTLTSAIQDANLDQTATIWDFGDGTVASMTTQVTHSWSKAGQYPIRLTVSDMKGGVAVVSAVINVGDATYLNHFAALDRLANTTTAGQQQYSAVASNGQDKFVVTWQTYNGDVSARRFSSLGTPLGNEFKVNQSPVPLFAQTAVAMDSQGNFVVVWEGTDSSETGIMAQRYDFNGQPLGTAFLVNTTVSNSQLNPAVAMDPLNGDFVVAWSSNVTNSNIRYRRYNANGVAKDSDEQSAAGGTAFSIADLAVAAGGDFVIAWDKSDANGKGVFAQKFNANGTQAVPVFQVNSFTAGDQDNPHVAIGTDGRFAIVWESNGQDGSGEGIYLRDFATNGVTAGPDIRVNEGVNLDQIKPDVALGANGMRMVSWMNAGSSNPAVHRVFDANGNPMGGDQIANSIRTNSGLGNTALAPLAGTTTYVIVNLLNYNSSTASNFDVHLSFYSAAKSTVQATADNATTVIGARVDINVLNNDTYSGANPPTVSITVPPSFGTAVVIDNGTPTNPSDDFIRYTPFPGYFGRDSIIYAATNSAGIPALAAVNVVVDGSRSRAPFDITIDSLRLGDGQQSGDVAANLKAFDVDPAYPTGAQITSQGLTLSLIDNAGGLFSLVGKQLVIANASQMGPAKSHKNFIVRATDADGLFYDETFTLTIQDTVGDGLLNLDDITRPEMGSAFFGTDVNQRVGDEVRLAGDINHDGFDDLVVGASLATVSGLANAGAVYVLFGSAAGLPASLATNQLNGSNGFVIKGLAANDRLGISIDSGADVNADGIDDLIIGAPGITPGQGDVYVVFGSRNAFPAEFDLNSLVGTNGFVVRNVPSSSNVTIGSQVGHADVNSDGADEVLIGAESNYGCKSDSCAGMYVVYGRTQGGFSSVVSSLAGGAGFKIVDNVPGSSDWLTGMGSVASNPVDVNGDGVEDLVFGRKKAFAQTGAGFVLYGQRDPFPQLFRLSSLNGTNGFRIVGSATASFGGTIDGVGDVNHDGFGDVILGDPDANGGQGEAFVVFGKANARPIEFNLSSLDGSNGFRITNSGPANNTGRGVGGGGDFNGDGISDLVASGNATAIDHQANVIYGRVGNFPPTLNVATALVGNNGFRVVNKHTYGNLGWRVDLSGDINGDGRADLVVGAIGEITAGVLNTGAAFVVHGDGKRLSLAQGSGGEPVQGTLGADSFFGGPSNDVISGGGGADVLNAGPGNDEVIVTDLAFASVQGGPGTDKLTLDNRDLTLDLTRNLNISGIEIIDIVGRSPNSLIVDPASVVRVSDTGELTVIRDDDDTVIMSPDWVPVGTTVIDGKTFNEFTASGKKLLVAKIGLSPTVNAGGPYTVSEGSSTNLVGSHSASATARVQWDLDNDGIFGETGTQARHGDETSLTAVFRATVLDGPTTVTVSFRVIDQNLNFATHNTTILVTNVAPQVNPGGTYAALLGSDVVLMPSAVDPAGSRDSLNFQWDFDNDGVFGEAGGAAVRGDETGATPRFVTTGLPAPSLAPVALRVSDDDGGSVLKNFTIDVQVRPTGNPIAHSGKIYQVLEGRRVKLDGSTNSSDDVAITDFKWDLDGDGIFGESGPNAARGDELGSNPTFDAAGLNGPSTVYVALRVTDVADKFDVDSAAIQIVNSVPTAHAGGPYTVSVSGNATLGGSAFDLGGDPVTFEWDLDGDGLFGETGAAANRGDETGAQPTFDSRSLVPGSVSVSLRVTDDGGLTSAVDMAMIEIVQGPFRPNAGGAYIAPEGGTVPLLASGLPATAGAHFEWDLDGDGVFGETGTSAARGDELGESPTFSAVGLDNTGLVVKLRVSGNLGPIGEVDTATVEVINASPVADPSGFYLVSPGGKVSLGGSANDPAGNADPLTFEWDLDDDGIFGETGAAAEHGDELGPQPTFISPMQMSGEKHDDFHSVYLRVRDDDGGVSQTVGTFVKENGKAPSAVAGGPYFVSEGGTVTLFGVAVMSTSPGGFTYEWDLDRDGLFGETGSSAANGDESGDSPIFVAAGLSATTSQILLAPAGYSYKAEFVSSVSTLTGSDATGTLTVTQENAEATYVGPTYVSTPNATANSVDVPLQATIVDINDLADPGGMRGNVDNEASIVLTNAWVTFKVYDASTNALVWTSLITPVNLINPADPTVGTAISSWPANIGSAAAVTYKIRTIVTNYYTRDNVLDDELVTVAKPLDNSIIGGGYIINIDSAGLYAADDNRKTNFGFNVKFNKNLTNVQGKVNVIFRRLETDGVVHVYQIKNTATNSLGINPTDGTSTFLSKATLTDVTNPAAPISLGGNLDLTVNTDDNGEQGTGSNNKGNDKVSVTLYNGPVLWFSSNWNGVQSQLQILDGGNIRNHPNAEKLLYFGNSAANPIAPGDQSVTEGNNGPQNMVFTIKLSQASSQTVKVDYNTADNSPAVGAATAGVDYVPKSGTLTFAPGVTTQTITIVVNGDTLDELDENFFINLSNPIQAGIQDPTAIGLILDNVPSAPLLVQGRAISGGNISDALSDETVQPLLAVAFEHWRAAGVEPLRLASLVGLQLQINDLSDATLGLASQGLIIVDRDAAGYGWFVDSTPLDDREFEVGVSSPASGLVDLLSVVTHELGHLLGYDHEHDGQDVMGEYLPVGNRRLPARDREDEGWAALVDLALIENAKSWQSRINAVSQELQPDARRKNAILAKQGATPRPTMEALRGSAELGASGKRATGASSNKPLIKTALRADDELLELLAVSRPQARNGMGN